MSIISLFEIIKVVVPEPYIFFWIFASIAEASIVVILPKEQLPSLMDLLIYLTMILKIPQTELFKKFEL